MDIRKVLSKIRPGAICNLKDNDYSNLEWLDQNQSKPTEQEFIDAWPQVELDGKWYEVRCKRDALLKETDWAFYSDSPISGQALTDLTNYRQTLRDIPQSFGSPDDVTWPTKP